MPETGPAGTIPSGRYRDQMATTGVRQSNLIERCFDMKRWLTGLTLVLAYLFLSTALPRSAVAFIGEIRMFAGTFAPANWSFCDGSLLSVTDYPDLYAVIGNRYGGDGSTTFALPDLRGRFAVGSGEPEAYRVTTPRTLGDTGGSETSEITEDGNASSTTRLIQGTDGSISVMPPFYGINFIIKLASDGVTDNGEPFLGEVRIIVLRYGTPEGWYRCRGQVLQDSAALLSIIGALHGYSENYDNYETVLPDFSDRLPVGAGTGDGLSRKFIGCTGGAEEAAGLVGDGNLTADSDGNSVGTLPPNLVLDFFICGGKGDYVYPTRSYY